jgi:hypothetical protein
MASVLAALRSSPSEMSAPLPFSRVTWLVPNAILVMPSAVSLPRTSTSSSRTSWCVISKDQAPSSAWFRRAMTLWPST